MVSACPSIVALAALAYAAALPPRTFGAGLPSSSVPVCAAPTTLLEHTIGADAALGILTHFWTTGDVDANVVVELFVDGAAEPAIAFEPAMACGQGFPGDTGGDPISPGGLYAAGGHMGKAGAVGGWYLKYHVPFVSLRAQIRLLSPGPCQYAYVLLRGHEVGPGDRGVVLPSGYALPPAARLQLQRIDNATFPPLSLVSVANVSTGLAAVLLQATLALSTRPPGNNYIEGCFHLLRTGGEDFPGLVVGTGFEDFFNSAYWFGAASGFPDGLLYAHADAGLLHFSRGPPRGPVGVERLSAYRFFDADVVGFEDGGRLLWRVGDQAAKCTANGTAGVIGTPSAVAVKSYAWLYAWPTGGTVTPLPPLPQPPTVSYACAAGACVLVPNASGTSLFADCDGACAVPVPSPVPGPPAVVGCASGVCAALCNASATVHGCVATWVGAASLRAPRTGAACGGALGPCAAPADACAAGWELCLGPASGGVAAFRGGITAAACAAVGADPRVFVAAMSHARPDWAPLPPAPCPPAPVVDDNGCAAPGGWGSEPVCCGGGCATPSCPNAVWPRGTRIHVGVGEACGGLTSDFADGVLCCRSGG